MPKNMLGEQISKFRKEAGLTQEELGRSVGVSTQAVSRWECGGTPDVELLPAIAGRLHVSVDALFGLEGGEAFDLKELLFRAVQNAPKEQCTETILEYIWVMQRAFVVNQTPEFLHILDILSSIQIADRSGEEHPALIPSQVTINNDASCMLHGISKDMRFALVLPDGGAGYAAMLKKPEEYLRLFTLLAKPHVLDMVIDVDMRSPEEHFTARLAAERLGISPQEAEEILDELSGCLMVNKLEVADASETLGVYQKNEEINLHVFLFFCGQLMHSVETIQCGINLRKKPVFHARPGSGSLTPEWKTKKEEEHRNEA